MKTVESLCILNINTVLTEIIETIFRIHHVPRPYCCYYFTSTSFTQSGNLHYWRKILILSTFWIDSDEISARTWEEGLRCTNDDCVNVTKNIISQLVLVLAGHFAGQYSFSHSFPLLSLHHLHLLFSPSLLPSATLTHPSISFPHVITFSSCLVSSLALFPSLFIAGYFSPPSIALCFCLH